MARPSDYTEQLADFICEAIIEGKSLRKICEQADMPDRRTIFRWLEAHPSFATKYARARMLQADYLDDLIQDTADASRADTAASDRVKIAAYQWRASKLLPKKYGDKLAVENTGADGGPIETNSTIKIEFVEPEKSGD